MASYYHKRHAAHSDTDAVVFIFVILLMCSFWEHKALMLQIEHLTLYVSVSVVSLMTSVFIVKMGKSLIKPRSISAHDLVDVDNMDGLEFERYVARLLETQGYGAVRLNEEYDYGVDIIAVKDGTSWGIQVKRYNGLVKANAVRQVVTALRKYRCDRAMVITNSYYSEVAKELARVNDCVLVDRNKLRFWVV